MADFIRDTTFGQVARYALGGRLFKFPEEKPGFQLPGDHRRTSEDSSTTPKLIRNCDSSSYPLDSSGRPRITAQQPSSGLVVPALASEKIILVDWYTSTDPQNPRNWSTLKKSIVYIQVNLYTFTVYMSSSIYTSAETEIMHVFGTSQTVASLGLALYVLGYGVGPLFLAPPSEIAAIGRNPPYVITFTLFVIFSALAALVNNIPGLMILRFLQGFFGSPALATGGGSIGDITSQMSLPYGLYLWAIFATGGPAFGPLISGFSVPVEGWRWALWEILWTSGPTLIGLIFLPETSSNTILLRRAKRIRKLTNNSAYRAQSEVDEVKLSAARIVSEALVIPWKINVLDPAILFTSFYCGLVYAIFYSFFEVFPLVYMDVYGMNLGEMGLVFLSVIIAAFLNSIPYFAYVHFILNPATRKDCPVSPERRLLPALVASMLLPIGIMLFAWTSRSSIHWVVPTIGVMLTTGNVCLIIQCIYVYIAMVYPRYEASLFGANDFARAVVAFAAILWAEPLYSSLGVAKGSTVLGCLCFGCVFGIFALYLFGHYLRARSKFAG
ncbi:hypothetical protein BP6252_08935 [Coleophoma cylindrospora]|uniref:Major facilitator superfamily (MFS) profile domain-containing protein n=1 Tax=Coleophoma cylindrospora TaxID=1849047 RepID=A0A3D8R0H4_9HELO|nr:hypothetical protein BP6252_08935 [Coleophoma cylindrospora]